MSGNTEDSIAPVSNPKHKPLKRTPSRVQFFVEKNLTSNHVQRGFRQEDSPSDSWKSEYSGTDLRKTTFYSDSLIPTIGKNRFL